MKQRCIGPGWLVGALLLHCSSSVLAHPSEPVTIHVDAKICRLVSTPKSPASLIVGGFVPDCVVVRQGQMVTLEVRSLEGAHSLGIPEYGVHSHPASQGETTRVTFLADKVGKFKMVCETDCLELHSRMTGRLIVTPSEVGR